VYLYVTLSNPALRLQDPNKRLLLLLKKHRNSVVTRTTCIRTLVSKLVFEAASGSDASSLLGVARWLSGTVSCRDDRCPLVMSPGVELLPFITRDAASCWTAA